MTAASSPPPRNGEVCAALVAELDTFLGQWRTVGAIPFELAGIVDRYRPAAPSEPPAADSPTPGTETRVCEGECGCRYGTNDPDRFDCGCDGPCTTVDDAVWLTALSPVDATEPPAETYDPDAQPWQRNLLAHHVEPPAETQEYDEVAADCGCIFTVSLGYPVIRCTAHFTADHERRAQAARPSADTETLRADAVQALARVEAEIADWPAADFWHRDAIRAAIQGEQR